MGRLSLLALDAQFHIVAVPRLQRAPCPRRGQVVCEIWKISGPRGVTRVGRAHVWFRGATFVVAFGCKRAKTDDGGMCSAPVQLERTTKPSPGLADGRLEM